MLNIEVSEKESLEIQDSTFFESPVVPLMIEIEMENSAFKDLQDLISDILKNKAVNVSMTVNGAGRNSGVETGTVKLKLNQIAYELTGQKPPGRKVNVYQDAAVHIPVEIKSLAEPGEIKTSCCGETTASVHENQESGKCCLTVIQPLRLEIPLEFGAEALVSGVHVQCGEE